MSNTSSEQLGNSTKILLAITTFTKLGFGIFYLAGSVHYHYGNHRIHLYQLCESIGRQYYDPNVGGYRGDWMCTDDVRGGLFVTGSILLLISIIFAAFIDIERNIYRTISQFIGGAFILIPPIGDWLQFGYHRYDVIITQSNFKACFWIVGGLLMALCESHRIHRLRLAGKLTIITYALSLTGSLLFMIYGILRIDKVAFNIVGGEGYEYDDEFVEYWNMSTGVLISACVLCILHAILYPFAIYKMIAEKNQGNDLGATYSNPNAYQKFPIKPLNDNFDEGINVSQV